jgi:sulfur carrier protein
MNVEPENVTTDTNRSADAELTGTRSNPSAESGQAQPRIADQIRIVVNGQSLTVPCGSTVSDVLQQQGVRTDLVAVEVNLEIVPKRTHSQTVLSEGDQIEVVTLVGGG